MNKSQILHYGSIILLFPVDKILGGPGGAGSMWMGRLVLWTNVCVDQRGVSLLFEVCYRHLTGPQALLYLLPKNNETVPLGCSKPGAKLYITEDLRYG